MPTTVDELKLIQLRVRDCLGDTEPFGLEYDATSDTIKVETLRGGRAICYANKVVGVVIDNLLFQLYPPPVEKNLLTNPTSDQEVKRYNLEGVLYREYEWVIGTNDDGSDRLRVYRIDKPVAFFWAPGHSTHRVLDSVGILHLVPAPVSEGCVCRQRKRDGVEPVKF